MNIWGTVKKLSLQEVFLLTFLMLRKPLLIWPTLKATKQTLHISDKFYGKTHHANGRENAFRHALWNLLICKVAYRVNKNQQKAVDWAKQVTDLHEDLSPNNHLEREMDLHNNGVGRELFNSLAGKSDTEIVECLIQKTKKSVRVKNSNEIKNFPGILVHL